MNNITQERENNEYTRVQKNIIRLRNEIFKFFKSSNAV